MTAPVLAVVTAASIAAVTGIGLYLLAVGTGRKAIAAGWVLVEVGLILGIVVAGMTSPPR